jgi:hypothetical protein
VNGTSVGKVCCWLGSSSKMGVYFCVTEGHQEWLSQWSMREGG